MFNLNYVLNSSINQLLRGRIEKRMKDILWHSLRENQSKQPCHVFSSQFHKVIKIEYI